MIKPQKYVFVFLIAFLFGVESRAQCLMVPNAVVQVLNSSGKIIEGRVVHQEAFFGSDGNIYTRNSIDVYRVFKGDVGFSMDVITEGGVIGDMMQVVTPSAQLKIDDYGVLVLQENTERLLGSVATAFYRVHERTGDVYGLQQADERSVLYDLIARSVGSESIELRRIPLDMLETDVDQAVRAVPTISTVYPLQVTAGTRTVITISGSDFGEQQGDGFISFRNADDGGQSFVPLDPGPHYLSWSDTEIQLFVPSATLFNSTVAGTGIIRVTTNNSLSTESTQLLSVKYAKTEVIYSEELNETMLVGKQNGGYSFNMNGRLNGLLAGSPILNDALEKWTCNTGVNFNLDDELVNVADWHHDGVNVIGLAEEGELPNYLLGRTVTTFSGCGTPLGIQWNLEEVDVLLNSDVDWWSAAGQPMQNKFDLATAVLHELGHAHLLQHNNNTGSPMYFQIAEGAMRRDLHINADVGGGSFVVAESAAIEHTCGDELHAPFDFSNCDLSLTNGVEDEMVGSMHVYPNPFTDRLVVQKEGLTVLPYRLLDVAGRTVMAGTLGANANVISTQELPQGIYFLSLENISERSVFKLIKN